MRAMGVALDKATLQQTLYEKGINRTYDSLTRAQKTELLYYQIMTQTSKMQGELGRTMTSPANMARIMKQEFTQLGRAIGTIFIPIAMKIIPVVRAITQELIKLARWLGGKAGYKETDYLYDYSDGLTEISGGLGGIEDSANGAAKAMNKMLMPFDELNNINFSSGSGSGSGIAGGAGGSLFDKLPSYDIFKDLSDDMNKKVEEYKAKIESIIPVAKALGVAIASAFAFKKLIEFLNWAEKVHTTLSNLGKLGGLIEIGLGTILSITGIWAQWKGVKKLLNGDYSIWAILETIGGTAVGTFGIVTILKGIQKMGGLQSLKTKNMLGISFGVMLGIASFETILDGITKDDMSKKLLGAIGMGFSVGTIAFSTGKLGLTWSIPIAIAATFTSFTMESIADAYNAGKAKDEQKAIQSELTSLFAGGVGGGFAGGVIGAKVGAIGGLPGIAIGATAGALFGGLAAKIAEVKGQQSNLNEETTKYVSILNLTDEELTKAKESMSSLIDTYNNKVKSIEDDRDATLLNLRVTEDYVKDLDSLTDSNGKVTASNKERANFILNQLNSALGTELKLNDDLIVTNGNTGESYNKIRGNIDELIKKKKEDAEQSANIELYKEAYKQRVVMSENLKKAAGDYQKLLNQYREEDNKGLIKNQKQRDKWQEKLRGAYANMMAAGDEYKNAVDTVASRSELAFGKIPQSLENQVPEVRKSFNNVISAIVNKINSPEAQTRISNAMKGLSNLIPNTFKKLLNIHSPSRVMEHWAEFVPLGIAEGINNQANTVTESMQDLTDRIRIDKQDYDFFSGTDFISSVNGDISTKTSASLSENTLESMANATYEGMARALTENNEDYNPQFNVYVGNDKVYSGYGVYQSNESNRYGVKV